jgi:hypothetical protein
MGKKRITKLMLRQWDQKHDSDLVRELEMHVDAVLIRSDYSPQFWTDASLYGIDEALLYLKNQDNPKVARLNSPEMKELEDFILVIRNQMQL